MTIIAAINNGQNVVMAGDRAFSNDEIIMEDLTPKIFQKSGLLVGFAGQANVCRSFEHLWTPPSLPTGRASVNNWAFTKLRESIKSWMDDVDLEESADEFENFHLLIGLKVKTVPYLFSFNQFLFLQHPHFAIGSGSQFALGVIYALQAYTEMDSERILKVAVSAATYYSLTCQGEPDVLSI